MFKLIGCSLIQCMFLAAGQVFLKFALAKMKPFGWTRQFFTELLTNWSLLASGVSMLVASLIWFYMLKRYDLSLVYPMISISYVFGTLAAVFIFHETVPLVRWAGVVFIMIGVALLTCKQS